jgi:hypothetical protein
MPDPQWRGHGAELAMVTYRRLARSAQFDLMAYATRRLY